MTNRRVDAPGVETDGDDAPDVVVQRITRALDESGILDEETPLYEVVDPGAITTLHRHAARDASGSTVSVEFAYAGHAVTVEVGGDLRVDVD